MVEQPLHNISNDLSNAVAGNTSPIPQQRTAIKGLDFTDWFERLPCKIFLKLSVTRHQSLCSVQTIVHSM